MPQDDKPSGQFRLDSDSDSEGPENEAEQKPTIKHKVIADIHSGMVMVAPVATQPTAEELAEMEEEADERPSGPVN